jgi:hypothetical protein
MSTPQLRANLGLTDAAALTSARLALARQSLVLGRAFSLIEALDKALVAAHTDGEVVSGKLLAAAVESGEGLTLALELLKRMVDSAPTEDAGRVLNSAMFELLCAQGKAQILEDEMRNDLLDLNRPPEPE